MMRALEKRAADEQHKEVEMSDEDLQLLLDTIDKLESKVATLTAMNKLLVENQKRA